MKLIKTASNKTVLRITYAEWLEIGKKFVKEAGQLPVIPLSRWLEYLKTHGYSHDRTKGDHQSWKNIDPKKGEARFSATVGQKEIHPIGLKEALAGMGVKLREFMDWYNEYYFGRSRKKKKDENVETEEKFTIESFPEDIQMSLWQGYLSSVGYRQIGIVGNTRQWYNDTERKKLFWMPLSAESVSMLTIQTSLSTMGKTLDDFGKWYRLQTENAEETEKVANYEISLRRNLSKEGNSDHHR